MDFVSVHSYCNDFPLVSCSDGALGAVYASGQSDGTLSGATSYYVNLYTAHAHLLGKAMEFSEYNQNLTSDPTGAWDRELLNFTTSENSDSSEIWAWESSGTATDTCSAGNAGTYTLTITGTSGALIQTATATFTFKAPGGICLSCISPTNWSSIEWLMIIGGFIGVVSSMALLNAKASTELDRIRRRGPTVRPSKKGLDG